MSVLRKQDSAQGSIFTVTKWEYLNARSVAEFVRLEHAFWWPLGEDACHKILCRLKLMFPP
jgi:hypothetical protein